MSKSRHIRIVLAIVSAVLVSTKARSLSQDADSSLSESDRLFIRSPLDASLRSVTNTTATIGFDAGKSLLESSYVVSCLQNTTVPFDCTSEFVNGTDGVLKKKLLGKPTPIEVTVTGLIPGSNYTCYVKVTKKLGLSKCSDPVAATTVANDPNPPQPRFLLITDSDGNMMKSCEIVGPSGLLGNCTDTALTTPVDVAVVPVTTQKLMYVTDSSSTGVSKCSYDLAGNVLGCTGATLNGGAFAIQGGAEGIVVTAAGLVTFAVDVTGGEIVQCDITPPGNDLTLCTSLNGVFAKPTIDVAYAVSSPYLYVVLEGAGGSIAKCAVGQNGRIISSTPCTTASTSGTVPPSFPTSITYAGVFNGDNVFYITDQQSGGIVIKAVENTQTGDLTLTLASQATFPSVSSLSVDPSGTIAYVSLSTTPGSVLQCDIDQTTAELTNCVAQQSVSVVNPQGMGFIPFIN